MKRKALIIPSGFRSHVLPTFFFADILSEDYEVIYAVTDKILEKSVHENGFNTHLISWYKVGYGLEKMFIEEQEKKVSFFSLLKSYLSNELYWNRKKEIDKLLEQVEPDVVMIDVFNSTDFIFFYSHINKFKVFFFNPMPSTCRVEGYPTVSDSVWVKNSSTVFADRRIRLTDFIKYPQETLLKWISENQIYKLFKLSKIPSKHDIVKNNFIKAFDNVPEILLLPLEFEVSPVIKRENQYYLGLCQYESRIDIEIDDAFEDNWQQILEKKQEGKRIIYCSFGTYFDKADPRLIDFINILLIAVLNIPNTFLVCSVNKYVNRVILSRNETLDNVIFFSRVPQLKVLEIGDLYITHGGLGGIKESISHEVPMLVYPLDLQNDQNGNGLKVEYHKIGLRGNFRYESVSEMREKIAHLLDDKKYKKNITDFNKNIRTIYTQEYCKDLLNNLLK
jgi:hypothetical protein